MDYERIIQRARAAQEVGHSHDHVNEWAGKHVSLSGTESSQPAGGESALAGVGEGRTLFNAHAVDGGVSAAQPSPVHNDIPGMYFG